MTIEYWNWPAVGLALILFIIFKFFATGLSIMLPIPCGVFTPMFTMGKLNEFCCLLLITRSNLKHWTFSSFGYFYFHS